MSSTANSKHYEMLIHNESCFMKYDVWLIPQIETGCLPYRVHQNICPGERTTIMMCYPGHIFSFIRSARMPAPITDPTSSLNLTLWLKCMSSARLTLGLSSPCIHRNLHSTDIDDIIRCLVMMKNNFIIR